MRIRTGFLKGGVLALAFWLGLSAQGFSAPGALSDPAVLRLLNGGMDALFNLEYEKAWSDFQKVRELRPDTPLGDIFDSEYYWWRIFNATGDFYALDYIDALKTTTSPYDNDFITTMDKAFAAGDQYLKNHPNDPEAYFHLGMSNALRSRLEAGRDHTFAVVKYVKRSHDYLDQCLHLDPNFKDAYLALGAYNFYVEEYGGFYKPLRFIIRLPAGDQKLGIQQLWQAAGLDNFVSTEAKFFLASIYLRDSEKNYAGAEKILREMSEKYPNNPIFLFALANSQKLQHKDGLALENFKKVAAHPETPHVGDLEVLVKKELASYESKK